MSDQQGAQAGRSALKTALGTKPAGAKLEPAEVPVAAPEGAPEAVGALVAQVMGAGSAEEVEASAPEVATTTTPVRSTPVTRLPDVSTPMLRTALPAVPRGRAARTASASVRWAWSNSATTASTTTAMAKRTVRTPPPAAGKPAVRLPTSAVQRAFALAPPARSQ